VLRVCYERGTAQPTKRAEFAERLQQSEEEVQISLDNLKTLNCVGGGSQFFITSYGSALVRARSD
jgi:hypothetical protein